MKENNESGKAMVVLIACAIVIVFGFGLLFKSCDRVPPGYVGIVVNAAGSNRGVEDYPVRTGRVWVNPFTEDLITFPTFQQTVSWTRDTKEGKPHDESFSFNAKGGTKIDADVSISYGFVPELVPMLYVEFKQTAENLTENYMRSRVRDAFNAEAPNFEPIDIVATKKQELLDAVKKRLIGELEPKGFRIDYVAFITAPRPPDNIQNAINSVIEAQQNAARANAEVARVEAEAKKQKAEAQGYADALLIRAKADADAKKLVQASLSPQQIQYEWLQKWNGVLPQVQGGAGTLIQLPK
jgi:regulator of protease activity HflC (stomatin/prohibitin superfamily)